ncbi:MAG: caspase family protein [Lachnospiraceae bacterium]|nr:caspase family protein [Lachnospiraceae bacterium]
MKTSTKKGLALVVANAEYTSQPKLFSCKKDGLDMKSMLESLNFDVIYSTNASRADMFNVINDFLKNADLYSVLLVYYAGHGVQIDGENYFVPIDCIYNSSKSIFIATALVGVNTIMDYMNEHPEKINIMILDACRSNPGFSRDIVGTGLAEIKAGSGTIIAFATSPNKDAGGESDGNGFYTKCLLRHIAHPNIKIEDMFKSVRNDVIALTANEQIPWENTSLNTDFYFNTMSQDEINEKIYQSMRHNYSAKTLLYLSEILGYSISDLMRIYETQKSEKPGGIYIKEKEVFEQLVLEHVLELEFEFKNYRWTYNDSPVIMGEFFHNPHKYAKV